MKSCAGTTQRARTPAQKQDRRRAILDAAGRHFRSSGFEGFSMAALARDAGVAKGTLYLYFATREEVLLELHDECLARWCAGLAAAAYRDIDDATFVAAFFDISRRDPMFLPLLARLDSVIEHNVSLPALVHSKQRMLGELDTLLGALEPCLHLSRAQLFDLLAGLTALMLGAQQADSGPSLQAENLPGDVRSLVDSFAADRIFTPNAARILAGIRGGDAQPQPPDRPSRRQNAPF